MSIMLRELFGALKEAGASETSAAAAAEEVAAFETRLARIETDVSVIKWMVGFNVAMTSAIALKLFV